MKVKKSFIVQCAVGAVLLIAGLLLQMEYYSTLIFAVGMAILVSALTQQARLCYWTSPKHRTEYEARQREAHIDRVLSLLDGVRQPDYYARMAVAWAVSIAYVRFPEKTLAYLKTCSLDDFTYNKALQKAVESRCVGEPARSVLRAMKR